MKEVFARAREIIEERGWTQRKVVDDDGCVCLDGAVRLACGGREERGRDCMRYIHLPDIGDHPEYYRARKQLTSHLGGGFEYWNDEPERTVDEVLELLNELATQ